MLNLPPSPATHRVRRVAATMPRAVSGDICVVGAGISGIAAALEAAKLGRRVILVDGLPALGGQAVNSIIGTFCGLFANGTHGRQLTHLVADELLHDLGAAGALHYRHGPMTTVVLYDEVALGRWVERAVLAAGIVVLLGAVLRGVERDGDRLVALDCATRYGDVRVTATGFVDASGDATLAWLAGLECQEPVEANYGSQMMVLEGIDEAHYPTREAISNRLAEKATEYGLVRHDGFAFNFPGRGTALVNMNHVATPLDPLEAVTCGIAGKDQADRSLAFLRGEFPGAFGSARVRAYGLPGIRQTRWIIGTHHLVPDEVRTGMGFDDAIARTAWPIEQHHNQEGYVWEPFAEDHLHYVPLGSMVPREAANLVAAGRCIDADAAALSSVRVMGPCIAMGAAAAHALDLANNGSLHQIDVGALRQRLAANLA
jgi:hypothetical protein